MGDSQNQDTLKTLIQNAHDNYFSQHPDDTRWPCPICGQLCKTQGGCKGHITRSHPEVNRADIANELHINEQQNLPPDRKVILKTELQVIIHDLEELLSNDEQNHDMLENILAIYKELLHKCEKKLSGPEHPAKRFYRLRKTQGFQNVDRCYKESSNPQRAYKRNREKRNAKYQRDMAQWLYYNQRKKAVDCVIREKNNKGCTIPLADLYQEFTSRWETPNNKCRPALNPVTINEQIQLDDDFEHTIYPEEIAHQIYRLNSQSCAGTDGILPRWIKATKEDSSIILAKTLTYMLKYNFVPGFMREAKTVLIHKGGDEKNPKNFRPITICSVLRRTVEKVIDAKLRKYVPFSDYQRGFTDTHGTLINTFILNCCLQKAKNDKLDYTATLFDVTQAFDKIGHEHAKNRIASRRAPTKLKDLTITLMKDNFTKISTINGKTKKIYFRCGVMQGVPTSPWIYNIGVDDEVEELNEASIKSEYGFELHQTCSKETLQNFADDSQLSAKCRSSSIILSQAFLGLYDQLGLSINAQKSQCISLVKGKLCTDDLVINPSVTIQCIGEEDMIKYLGTSYNDEIKFDSVKILKKFHNQIEALVSSPLLNADQKFNIINEFIWPILIFPFQHAPIGKIPYSFLENVDKILKSATKQILQIPNSTPDAMLYSNKKFKGLGLIKATWEAYIQSYNASSYLAHSDIQVLKLVRDLQKEKQESLSKLGLSEEFITSLEIHSTDDHCSPPPTDIPLRSLSYYMDRAEESITQPSIKQKKIKNCKKIRNELQSLEFVKWINLPTKGKGVQQFAEYPPANSWLTNKRGLSTSEWTNAIKMTANVLPVRSNPGFSQGNNRCRYCNEYETLGHILGKCSRGELLRNTRHHTIRTLLATKLREGGFKVEEEVFCEDPMEEVEG